MNLVQMLRIKFDLWSKRYGAFLVQDQHDIDACMRILELVRSKELNRVSGNSPVESQAFSGREISYRLIACRDSKSGDIIGCIRITPAIEVIDIPSSRTEYHLDLFDEQLMKKLTIFTRLAIKKEFRKTPASLVLMSYSFLQVISEGYKGVLMSCEPNLLPLYKKLGLRPIGPMHNSPNGGFRIPMLCIPDKAYFKNVGSPALPLLGALDFTSHLDICQWYDQNIGDKIEQNVGAEVYREGTGIPWHTMITNGLSKKGLQFFLKNAIELNCHKGDVLIAEDDGGRSFGFIKEGNVRVMFENEKSILLGEGDVFGEIAFILNTRRSAKVMAADPHTTVVMFSISALNRLQSEKDKGTIWRNLARILAQKILRTNEILQ